MIVNLVIFFKAKREIDTCHSELTLLSKFSAISHTSPQMQEKVSCWQMEVAVPSSTVGRCHD